MRVPGHPVGTVIRVGSVMVIPDAVGWWTNEHIAKGALCWALFRAPGREIKHRPVESFRQSRTHSSQSPRIDGAPSLYWPPATFMNRKLVEPCPYLNRRGRVIQINRNTVYDLYLTTGIAVVVLISGTVNPRVIGWKFAQWHQSNYPIPTAGLRVPERELDQFGRVLAPLGLCSSCS